MKLVLSFLLIYFTISIFSSLSSGGGGNIVGTLQVAVDEDDLTMDIGDTDGWLENDVIVIDEERIYYSSTTDTELVVANVSYRGYYKIGTSGDRTDASSHSAGVNVYTRSSSLFNRMSKYNIGLIAEEEGWLAFIKIPIAIVILLLNLFTIDLSGILGYASWVELLENLWSIVGIAGIVWFVFTWRSGSTV